MRILYNSTRGGKPMMIGMNHAKRIARRFDQRDQLAVLATLGPGLPRQHQHHKDLIKQRHAYYADVYEEIERERDARANYSIRAFEAERVRQAAPVAGDSSGGGEEAGDADGAVPDAEDRPADQ